MPRFLLDTDTLSLWQQGHTTVTRVPGLAIVDWSA
jgi:hypothetical protein